MRHALTAFSSCRAALGAAGVFVMLAGCKREAPTHEPTPDPKSAGAPAAGTAPAAAPTPVAAAANPNARCPAGRWSYDYSDQALEVMMKNVGGAKVLKEEGSFICNVSEGTQGTTVCETQGKPVQNVVETNQAGMKMTISVTIEGKASTRFTLLDAQRMKVVSSDTSGLKIGTTVTLGGKEIPFPTEQLVGIFGKPESTMSYKCESGKLYIKPEMENAQTTWQELEPVK
jgi:hypothetical protein